ncbi:MAG: OmpW family outer membrane protein [Legionella sp.]|nr:OmpW family outer membrane protein [Legionella sp.]
MKQLIKFSLISSLVLSSSVYGGAYASDPVEGFYLGLLGEISHISNIDATVLVNQNPYTGKISVGPVGGGAGGAIGYKVQSFRFEGELLVNANSFGELKVGTCTLISPAVLGPQGICPDFVRANGLGFKGTSLGIYGLFNAYYDFLPGPSSDRKAIPYIGLGLGYAQIKNTIQIQNNQYAFAGLTPISVNSSVSKSGVAGQGILGVSYYLDDYAVVGVDFRYLTSSNSQKTNTSNSNGSRFGVSTINFVGSFALGK